jgi:hypothetical protein
MQGYFPDPHNFLGLTLTFSFSVLSRSVFLIPPPEGGGARPTGRAVSKERLGDEDGQMHV